MIPLPDELLEQAGRGNVLLFVGERIAPDSEGRCALDCMAARIAACCGVADAAALDFPALAQQIGATP